MKLKPSAASRKPFLHLIRHPPRRAGHREVPAPTGEALVKLAYRQGLALRQIGQQLLTTALTVLRLRTAHHVQKPRHGEMRAAVIQLVQPGRIVRQLAGLVARQRIGVPTIPQSCDNLMKFTRPRITLGVRHMLLAAAFSPLLLPSLTAIRRPDARSVKSPRCAYLNDWAFCPHRHESRVRTCWPAN